MPQKGMNVCSLCTGKEGIQKQQNTFFLPLISKIIGHIFFKSRKESNMTGVIIPQGSKR